MIIGGEPKTNKSWLAIEMALNMARGECLFGGKYKSGTPVFPVSRKVKVLYLEQEIGDVELQKRLRSRLEGVDASGVELYVNSKNLEYRLDTEDGFQALMAEVASIAPEVLILDPMSKFHLSEENSSQQMGAVLRCGQILTIKHNCALIYIHHTSKPNYENPRRGGDRLRGSSAMFADVDTCCIVERKSPESAKEPILELDFETRTGAPLEKIYVQRKADGSVIYLGEDYRWMDNSRSGQFSRGRNRVYDPLAH